MVEQSMRLLIAAFGSRGDVQPMLALAETMQGRGHSVSLLLPPSDAAWANTRGLDATGVGMDFRQLLKDHGTNVWGALPRLRREIAVQGEALYALAKDRDLVIGSGFAGLVSSAAQRWKVPYRFVALSPSLLPSRFHPSPTTPWQRLPGWANQLSWGLNNFIWNRIARGPINRIRRAWSLEPVPRIWDHFIGDAVLLAADAVLAPAPPDARPRVEQTGAFFFDDHARLPDALEQFLGAGLPPVYVGFGSMPDATPAKTGALFVEAARRAGVRLVLARGWAALDAPASHDVYLLEETAHASLFPRCSAIVHHGGAGTTAAAARAGVCQIIVPHLLDQHYWATRAQRAGLCVATFPRASLTVGRVARALRAARLDEAWAVRAKHFAKEMRVDGLTQAALRMEAAKL
jgi:vancomycin aglycone glucosyltransferase